jgi:hypothetical protein
MMPKTVTFLTDKEKKELRDLEEKEARERGEQPEPEPEPEPEVVDPVAASGGTSEAPQSEFQFKIPKRRKNAKMDKAQASDLNGLLWMVHKGLASVTGIEELELAPEESKELAESIARVQAFYPNSVMSPLAMAWVGLFITTGKVYGTRVIAVVGKKKKKPSIVEIPLPPGTQANDVPVN